MTMTDPIDHVQDEMTQGYRDGLNTDAPEPSDNRSHSYRHGFKMGRIDLNNTSQPVVISQIQARSAIAKDIGNA
jgi:hypothetical protein